MTLAVAEQFIHDLHLLIYNAHKQLLHAIYFLVILIFTNFVHQIIYYFFDHLQEITKSNFYENKLKMKW